MTKEQDAKSEDKKNNPKQTNRDTWGKAPDVLQEKKQLRKGGSSTNLT